MKVLRRSLVNWTDQIVAREYFSGSILFSEIKFFYHTY